MKFPRIFWSFFFFAPLLGHSFIGCPAFAQISANLRGRVLDPSGATVANANVELIASRTNVHQSTTTSSTGDYIFTNLNPGPMGSL